MAREKILAALRRLDGPSPLERLRAAASVLSPGPSGSSHRERLRAAWRAARGHPERVLAAAVVAGVAAMVLHWS